MRAGGEQGGGAEEREGGGEAGRLEFTRFLAQLRGREACRSIAPDGALRQGGGNEENEVTEPKNVEGCGPVPLLLLLSDRHLPSTYH